MTWLLSLWDAMRHCWSIGKVWALSLLAAVLIVAVAAAPSYTQEKIIAVSFPNYSKQGAVVTTLEQAHLRGSELGYKVILDDPGDDLNKQVNTIKTWISQKVPAIIAVALNPEVFEGLAKQARDAGIVWLTYAAKLQNQDATVGFDLYEPSFELGAHTGKWIKNNLGDKAEVVILGFEKGAWGQKRANGLRDGLRSIVPDVKIVAEQDALSPAEGLDATRSILQANPKANVILAVVDPAAEGAYKAWINSGREKGDPKAFIGGVDGTIAVLRLLRDGDTVYRASMALPLRELGTAMAELADEYVKGKKPGDRIVPLVLVTAGSPLAQKFLEEQGAN
jgi:ribose transport system substrate-binding protein